MAERPALAARGGQRKGNFRLSRLALGLPTRVNQNPDDESVFSIFPHALPTGLPDKVYHPGVGDWHSGGANMLFCDGNVERRHRERWTVNTRDERRKWNFDHQAHEETQ